jgi:hypothetical protein
MAPRVIVSYDNTQNDRDALMLGRLLHNLGAPLTRAYVRHAPLVDPAQEHAGGHRAVR